MSEQYPDGFDLDISPELVEAEVVAILDDTEDICRELTEVHDMLVQSSDDEDYRAVEIKRDAIKIAWTHAVRKAYDGRGGLEAWLTSDERLKSDYDKVVVDAYEFFEPQAVNLVEQREKLLSELKLSAIMGDNAYEGTQHVVAHLAERANTSPEGAEAILGLLSNDLIEEARAIKTSRTDDHTSMIDFIKLAGLDSEQVEGVIGSEPVKIVKLILETSPDKDVDEVLNMIAANFESWPSSLDQSYLRYLRDALKIDLRILQREAKEEKPVESFVGIAASSKNRSKYQKAFDSKVKKTLFESKTASEVELEKQLEQVVERSGLKVAGLISSGGDQIMELEAGFEKLSRKIQKYVKKFKHNPGLADEVIGFIEYIAHNPRSIGTATLDEGSKTKIRNDGVMNGSDPVQEHRFSPHEVSGLRKSAEGSLTRIIYIIVIQDDGSPAIGIKQIFDHGREYESYIQRAR